MSCGGRRCRRGRSRSEAARPPVPRRDLARRAERPGGGARAHAHAAAARQLVGPPGDHGGAAVGQRDDRVRFRRRPASRAQSSPRPARARRSSRRSPRPRTRSARGRLARRRARARRRSPTPCRAARRAEPGARRRAHDLDGRADRCRPRDQASVKRPPPSSGRHGPKCRSAPACRDRLRRAEGAPCRAAEREPARALGENPRGGRPRAHRRRRHGDRERELVDLARRAPERDGRAEAATGLAQRDAHPRRRAHIATTAAPFGCDATSGHEYDSPEPHRLGRREPARSACSSSIPPFVQRDSSPGAPVARTHVATPATGRNGSSPNVSARAGAAASRSRTAAASSRISAP